MLLVRFEDENGEIAGGLDIYFWDEISYQVKFCMGDYEHFPENLPTDHVRIWTISLSAEVELRLIVECNGVQVVNFLVSDNTCEDSVWAKFWNKDVAQINLDAPNGALQGFRPAAG